MPSTSSRRGFLTGLSTGVATVTAGCLADDSPIANCSGYGEGFDDDLVLEVGTLSGTERLSLGVLVADEAPVSDDVDAIVVRNRDGDLVADVPLRDNREMSDLEPDIDPRFENANGGELYAVPIGPPPQHADLTIDVVDPEGTVLDGVEYRFNCYRADEGLP